MGRLHSVVLGLLLLTGCSEDPRGWTRVLEHGSDDERYYSFVYADRDADVCARFALRSPPGWFVEPKPGDNVEVRGAKLEFTVIGDTVNTAARLQEHTKNVHAAVVVSGQTVAALVERSGLERREPVLLRGRTTPVEVFVMEDRPSENTDSPLTAPRAGPS